MAELAGAMVGNYFLLESLGREGMVETYLARPTTHGGYDVYLRLFRPSLSDPVEFQEHFSSEVRKLWRSQHSAVQPLVEFGEGEDLLYVATRAEGGSTLAQSLEQQGSDPLALPLIAALFVQLCDALQYVHAQGMVHGNIQPSSILLGSNSQLSLTNFGLKRAYQDGDPVIAQIEEGNAAYVAPEQVVGMLEPASDIYALGVLLYRLLAGVLPYDGESAGEIAMLHANEPVPSLRALRPEISEAVELVVHVALAKDAAARFRSPRALATAFLSALAEDRPPLLAVTPARRIAVKARRTELTWSRAFSLLALALVFVGLSSTFYLISFVSPLRNLTRGFAGQNSIIPISLPHIGVAGQPSPVTTVGTVSARPTPQNSSSPSPGQSPVVTLATPTPVSPSAPSGSTCVPGPLKMDGSFYLAPLLQQVGKDYQAFCPGLALTLGERGCRVGLRELAGGQLNLAVSDLSVMATPRLVDYPIAALLYTVIVSPDVQIGSLSSQQLLALYRGQVTNWSQLGGPDEAIKVLLHPSSDPLKAIFQSFVLKGATEHVKGIALAKNVSTAQIARQVAQTPGAISYIPLAVAGVANVHTLAIDQVQPSLSNLLQGSYAFWSVEHLYAVGGANAEALSYIQFIQSEHEANRLAQIDASPFNLISPVLRNTHLPGPLIAG